MWETTQTLTFPTEKLDGTSSKQKNRKELLTSLQAEQRSSG
jgi:hypothetical protein